MIPKTKLGCGVVVHISPREEILITEHCRMSKLHFVSYTDMDDSGESYLVMQASRETGIVLSFIDLCHTNQHVHL